MPRRCRVLLAPPPPHPVPTLSRKQGTEVRSREDAVQFILGHISEQPKRTMRHKRDYQKAGKGWCIPCRLLFSGPVL